MIVLDTDVISALMHKPSDPVVLAWLDRQPGPSVWTTAVNVFEVRFGIEILAAGHRRVDLLNRFERLVHEVLKGRVLPFDANEAAHAAVITSRFRMAGRPSGVNDGLIAGIVRSHRATFATRHTKHFAIAGIALVDPWDASESTAD